MNLKDNWFKILAAIILIIIVVIVINKFLVRDTLYQHDLSDKPQGGTGSTGTTGTTGTTATTGSNYLSGNVRANDSIKAKLNNAPIYNANFTTILYRKNAGEYIGVVTALHPNGSFFKAYNTAGTLIYVPIQYAEKL